MLSTANFWLTEWSSELLWQFVERIMWKRTNHLNNLSPRDKREMFEKCLRRTKLLSDAAVLCNNNNSTCTRVDTYDWGGRTLFSVDSHRCERKREAQRSDMERREALRRRAERDGGRGGGGGFWDTSAGLARDIRVAQPSTVRRHTEIHTFTPTMQKKNDRRDVWR